MKLRTCNVSIPETSWKCFFCKFNSNLYFCEGFLCIDYVQLKMNRKIHKWRWSLFVPKPMIIYLHIQKTMDKNNVYQRCVGLTLVLFREYMSLSVNLIPVARPSLCATPLKMSWWTILRVQSEIRRHRNIKQPLEELFLSSLHNFVLTQVKFPWRKMTRDE